MLFRGLPGIEKEMAQVSATMEAILPPEWKSESVRPVIEAVLSGRGKGYRPGLLLTVARFGPDCEENRARLCLLGALAEYIHMASLIHDDVIDESELRRGQPTIQSRFGKKQAVFAGDLILGQVLSILLREQLIRSGILLADTVRDMCCGEIRQEACRFRMDVTREMYYQNIYGKTASMFVSVCRIGALESGCEADVVETMADIGLHLGYLFQIRDDLLDFSPLAEQDGKRSGMDFAEGIFTLPVIYALETEFRAAIAGLRELALEKRFGTAQQRELNELIKRSGGFQRALEDLTGHEEAILQRLSTLPDCAPSGIVRHLVSLLTGSEFLF